MSSYHQYAVGETARLHLGRIAYFSELNCRKKFDKASDTFKDEPAVFDPTDSETKVLIASLQDRGYDPQWPAVVGQITDEQKVEAVVRLTKKWEDHKAMDSLSPNDLSRAKLLVFEYFYTVEKKGKRVIVVPDFLGCTGNRRADAVFHAAVGRLMESKIGKIIRDVKTGDEVKVPADAEIFNHPETVLSGLEMVCVIEHFKDMDARRKRQIAENETKTEGFKKLSPIEVILNYREPVITGRMKQIDIRESQNDGTGQKIYGFIILDARFPKLKLMDRLMLPPTDTRHINWGRLPQGAGENGFPATIRDSDEYSRRKYIEKMEATNKADKIVGELLSEEMVEARIQEWMTGKNKPKITSQPVMKELQKGHPSTVIKNIFQDVLENTKKEIDLLAANAPAFNSLRSLVGSLSFVHVNEWLSNVAAMTEAERAVFFKIPEAKKKK